ncbi:NAC domain-containing protein 41 [Impatiens glandulifera]|uniref:NAC domain-containing protein 41 n=1 Tax=Impatiens glandulifera TaxID=253017 RepID=UPI001FB18FEE|nr:NAC domain-containing protein 41 [Impatiens glandulifera]
MVEMFSESFQVTNGGINLPIGFRFRPTDEELIVHYLKRKALSLPLPVSVIPVVQVFHSNPWDLPGDLKEKRYFFNRGTRKWGNNEKVMMSDGYGFWKAVGKEKSIINFSGVVGMRRKLVFFHLKSFGLLKSSWVMHEFRLTDSQQKMEADWVVCKIYEKKKRVIKFKDNHLRGFVSLVPTLSSGSCSSGITEDVPNFDESDDGEEETSALIITSNLSP